MRGLEFRETMTGSYELHGDGTRPRSMSFTIRARTGGLLGFVRRPVAEIEGEIDAEGLADHRLLRGTLDMDVVRKGELAYAFTFAANDGAACAFQGKKTVVLAELRESMTVLPGVILRGGAEIARAVLRFDLRGDLVRFLKSWKPSR